MYGVLLGHSENRGAEQENQVDHDQQRSNRHFLTVKLEAPSAVYAPDDGRRGARNMLSHT